MANPIPTRVKRAVLRAKKGMSRIKSGPDHTELALLRYAKEAMEHSPHSNHGILSLLKSDIEKNLQQIRQSERLYEVSWVSPRKKQMPPKEVFERFFLLVKVFLNQSGPRAHNRSRTEFWIWFKVGINDPNPSVMVRRILGSGPAAEYISKMHQRAVKDCFHTLKADFFAKNVQR